VTTTSQSGGPGSHAKALGANVVSLLRLRAELIAVELEEETARRKRLLVLAAVAGVFALATLLLVAFLLVAIFWDTYRVAALAAVTLAYGLAGAWAWFRFRDVAANSPPPFAATLAEFRKDLEIFRGSDGGT
jgi:uncharacterized membrane protein YqjE